MTNQTGALPKRKTEQAIKISASWTPGMTAAVGLSANAFGVNSPLRVRGGRLTINAAIAIDMTDPAQAARVAARVAELRKELEATGTVHSFTTIAGSVPTGAAERNEKLRVAALAALDGVEIPFGGEKCDHGLAVSNAVFDPKHSDRVSIIPFCLKCGGPMNPGIALEQTYVTGVQDFPSQDESYKGQTFSAGGAGEVVPCLKCENCGWSVSG